MKKLWKRNIQEKNTEKKSAYFPLNFYNRETTG